MTIWDTHGGQNVTVDELMKEAVTYRHFMGMPLVVALLLLVVKLSYKQNLYVIGSVLVKENIHTCLDTNGFVRRYDPVIDELMDVTDLSHAGFKTSE